MTEMHVGATHKHLSSLFPLSPRRTDVLVGICRPASAVHGAHALGQADECCGFASSQGGPSSRPAHRSWRPAAALPPQGLQQSASALLDSDDEEDVLSQRRGATVMAYDPNRCDEVVHEWLVVC